MFTDPPPLLTYAMTSVPDPIGASSPSTPAVADLTIIVANGGNIIVEVDSISFGLKVGTNSDDFTPAVPTDAKLVAPDGWTFVQTGSTFTARPTSAANGKIGGQGVYFRISNILVNGVGVSKLTVTETTTPDSGSGNHTGIVRIDLPKFPPGFQKPTLSAAPDTVPAGGSTVLTWSGSAGTYVIRYDDPSGNTVTISHAKGEPDQPLPPIGNYRVDDLMVDTIFYLAAVFDLDGEDGTAEDFFPVIVKTTEIGHFDADTMKVTSLAGTVTLTWQTENADHCELWSSNATNALKVPASSGGFKVAPIVETIYKLKAIGSSTSDVDTRQVTIASDFSPGWTKPTSVAPWGALGCDAVVLALGGRVYVIDPPHQSVYSSNDGVTWAAETTAAPWDAGSMGLRAAGVVYQDRLWLTPQWNGGAWSSADGKNWTQVGAGFPGLTQGLVAFGGTMWTVSGPYCRGAGCGGPARMSSWISGTNWWSHSGTNLPVTIRPTVVAFGGKIWVLGGCAVDDMGNAAASSAATAWSSSDGLSWTAAPTPPWSARFAANAAVVGNKLWLIGGNVLTNPATPAQSTNEIWVSSDPTTGGWTKSDIVAPLVNSPIVPQDFWVNNASVRVLGSASAGTVLWFCGGQDIGGAGAAVYAHIALPPYDQPLTPNGSV